MSWTQPIDLWGLLQSGWEYVDDLVLSALFIVGTLVLAIALGWVLARLLRGWTERVSAPLGAGRASLVARVVSYALFVAVVLGMLYAVGAPVGGLLNWVAGAAGIAGVAIGFASQTSATNVISGIFLLGERPFEEGDFIELAGITGEVLAVDLLSTKLRTFENTFVRIPNETVMRASIVNLSRFPIRRIDIVMRLRAGATMADLKRIVIDVAFTDPKVLVDPTPSVLFVAVTEGGVDLKFTAWTSRDGFGDTKARFGLALVARLASEGYEMLGSRRDITQRPPSATGEH